LKIFFAVVCFISVAFAPCTMQDNTDYDNGFLTFLYNIPSADACCAACQTFAECTTWSWVKLASAGAYYQRCYIKSSTTGMKSNNATTAGTVTGPPPPALQCGSIEDNTDYNNGWLSLAKMYLVHRYAVMNAEIILDVRLGLGLKIQVLVLGIKDVSLKLIPQTRQLILELQLELLLLNLP